MKTPPDRPWLRRPLKRGEIFDIEEALIAEANLQDKILQGSRGRNRDDYISRKIEAAGLAAVIVKSRILPVVIKNEHTQILFAIRVRDMDEFREFIERHYDALLKPDKVIAFPSRKARRTVG